MKFSGWFRRNNTIMAQAKDLQRQWQEMRYENGQLEYDIECLVIDRDYQREQLHRVARERDNERKLRLDLEEYYDELLTEERMRRQEAECALLDYHLDNEEE